MIKLGPPGSVTKFSVTVHCYGDGVGDTLVIDLEKGPFGLDFQSNPPSDVALSNLQVIGAGNVVDSSYSATATINRQYLTVTFNKATPASSSLVSTSTQGFITFDVALVYQGVG